MPFAVRRFLGTVSFWVLVALLIGSPVWYWAILNTLGPSTEYHRPYIEGAKILPSGKYVAYVGDTIYVRYTVVRHKINGDCLLNVYRYGEAIGGPENGQRHLLDYVDLRFLGANDLLRPRWPLDGLVLETARYKWGAPKPDEPLIPDGFDEQELALYVVARYYCNPLDYIFPRHIQGGNRADETARVNLILRRNRPK